MAQNTPPTADPAPSSEADADAAIARVPEFLSTLPAGRADRRTALALAILSVLVFLVLAPWAKTPLTPIWGFVPIYETVQVVTSLLTALLLLGQFSILRHRALAILAGGYLFCGLMGAFHAMAFPGLFSPAGLLGANTQSSAWMYLLWHVGFALFVIAYAQARFTDPRPDAAAPSRYWVKCAIGAVALAIALAALTTQGQHLLPALLTADGYTTTKHLISAIVWVVSLVALAVLFRHRSASVLDTWLICVVFTGLVDVMLSTQFNGGRFDLGFYAGRTYGALAASLVLGRLLLEHTRLYARETAYLRVAERNEELRQEIGLRLASDEALRGAESDLRAHQASLEAEVADRTTQLEAANRQLGRELLDRRMMEAQLRSSEARFRLLYENAPLGIAHIGLDGHWTFVNDKFAEITGYAPDEIMGTSYLDLVPPESREAGAEVVGKLLAGELDIQREARIVREDGSLSWVRLTARMLRNDAGKPVYGIATLEDINERRRAEAALRESEERFRDTFENAPLGIGKTNLQGTFIRANPKLLQTLGYSLTELTRIGHLDIIHPADREQNQAQFEALVAGRIESYVAENRFMRKDGSFVWMAVSTGLRRIEGKPEYVIGMYEDVTARRKAEEERQLALEQSYHLANHDPLTGLANRANFNDRLQDALNYARRDDHMVALHLLDLDRFKSVNDTYGHHAGDLLLKEVAERIKAHTRSSDFVARLGGDEFVVIQTHLAAGSAAGVLAGKIVAELERPFHLDGDLVYSGTSIGIAVFPVDADAPDVLLRRADLALYDAKGRGRHNFQYYRNELGAAFAHSQRQERALRRALEQGQFRLQYQPQFDLASGRINGIEALLRWEHPDRGLLPAADFLHHATDAGLMPALGEWILHQACTQHRHWIDAGLDVPLALNLSLQELRNPRFHQTLVLALEDTQLPASRLQLDICESVLWDPKLPIEQLQDAKRLGVRLAVDDFGAELAALSSLYRFPLDVVKPGRRLISRVPSHAQEASVFAAVVNVAHELGIEVCAAGVETQAQLDAARRQGCDAAQGFLLGKPVDAQAMERLVEESLAER